MEPFESCKKYNVDESLIFYEKYKNVRNSDIINLYLHKCNETRKNKKKQNKFDSASVECEICKEEKSLENFAKSKKYYKKKICVLCYPSFLKNKKVNSCKKDCNANINYRIKKSLAARLRNVLEKNDTTMNYIGCNIQYLREWFEYNFTEEMNWDNYGYYWFIDHVIPIYKFDLSDEIEKLKCWNWSNMIPVPVNFNSKKNINMNQINHILEKIKTFKEEGSTTKWFSEEFVLNMELVQCKL